MAFKYLSIVDAYALDSNAVDCKYEEISVCPICNFGIIPQAISGCYVDHAELSVSVRYTVDILNLCPHCKRIFLAKYSAYQSGRGLRTSTILGTYPKHTIPPAFSQLIQDMSPMFAETFSQSVTAEAKDLMEIAGCGYRKSVEYLVKDYLCHKFPDQSEKIKSEFLGKAIGRIEDSRVRTLAERAVWIGNDETHYVKKHEALDITDMKRFISAMLHFIEAELSLEEALSISPER